ncbi:MAG TPA: cupin domain-containing protein, partial [Actinomycetota bacterium]|nr:cupin domain-containing protein [Actinomycetota bacterium]
ENLSPSTWSNGPGDKYSAHSHGYRKVLYCLRGSIVFNVEGESVNLQPGDRLEIPPGTSHSADVGPEGVSCMEAARH